MTREFNKKISKYMTEMGSKDTFEVSTLNHIVVYKLKKVKNPLSSSKLCNFTFVIEVLDVKKKCIARCPESGNLLREEDGTIAYQNKSLIRPDRKNVNYINNVIRNNAKKVAHKIGLYFSVDWFRIKIGEVIYPSHK